MSSKVLIRAAQTFTEILARENPGLSQNDIAEIVEKRIQKLKLLLEQSHEPRENGIFRSHEAYLFRWP